MYSLQSFLPQCISSKWVTSISISDVGDINDLITLIRSANPLLVSISSCNSNLLVKSIKVLSSRTVYIKPPITDKVLLIEECSVRTQEAVLEKTIITVITADMKSLTWNKWIRNILWSRKTYSQPLDHHSIPGYDHHIWRMFLGEMQR